MQKEKKHLCLSVSTLAVLITLLFLNMTQLEKASEERVATVEIPPASIPPTLALTTFALGPLRGLIVDALWWRMIQHQDEGNYFEIMQLSEWITALQPKFPQIWAYNAWNLAYNVAYEFPDPESRWKWIHRAIRMLRDDALRNNPADPIIHAELARIFQDRIARRGDPNYQIFQLRWALILMKSLPRGSRENISELCSATEDRETVLSSPEVRELLELAKKAKLDLTDASTSLSPENWNESQKALRENEKWKLAWSKLLPVLRADYLRNQLRMDPQRMLEIDRTYGPFDWRLPQAHTVYWASDDELYADYLQGGEHTRAVLIRQAMQSAFHQGRLIYDPETGFFMATNNLRIAGHLHDYFGALLKNHYSVYNDSLHKGFVEEACAIFYSYGLKKQARELYHHYLEAYPLPPGVKTFEQFVMKQMDRVVSARNYSSQRTVVHATLYQAFFWGGAGDPERCAGYINMAKMVWLANRKKYANSPGYLLPPFEKMKKTARRQILDNEEIEPFIKQRISALGSEIQPGQESADYYYLGDMKEHSHASEKEKTPETDSDQR